ncbi:hypothetical protein KIN20_016117 [Parelaphostrongylus tenuis]|uniref:GCC2 Rab binding domain-containing protein n=1 Tax=Parelaphostrongylus tenuis TaxID=148309 RepID=A0AAD5MH04_PARTN|nr:hypothetical protein KIN20_016117 [Parelaphostrongylus tenuis]
MVQLNKSLKDAEHALEASNSEKEKLIQELSTQKLSTDRMNTDCLALQRELQEVRNKLHEQKCIVRELTSAMDKLQDNSNILIAARTEELVTLEAKMARNEELLAYWQRNSDQKSAELSDLLAENLMLRTRCDTLEDDFLSYKSRARYVLEQQAKSVENGPTKHSNVEAVQQALMKVSEDLEELRVAQKTVISDARKYRDQCMKYESINRSTKAHALELQQKLMRTNEELLDCNMMLELRASDCLKYQSQISEMEEQLQDLSRTKEKALQLIEEQVANRSIVEAELTTELEKQKSRYEELMQRLSEVQKERARASPETPTYLHRSDSQHPRESNLPAPRQCTKMSLSTLADDEGQHERSLEEVLFGEDFVDQESRLNVTKMLSSLMDENERILKQLWHTSELLKESEATNATLIDQSVLLKEEIRRLERNGERLSHFENSEYLKNIIVKFFSPERVAGERMQLMLNRAASQDDVQHGESESSWGSYLRWGRLN